MEKVPDALEAIIKEVEGALNAKLYYLAIAVALSLPDICACLEFDPEKPKWANRNTYAEWCNANIKDRLPHMTGDDLYNLRGGVLHKGRFEHKDSRFARVLFVGPESHIKMHGLLIKGDMRLGPEQELWTGPILNLGVQEFCATIVSAAREWGVAKCEDAFVKANLSKLVRYRPNGIPPFSHGVPTVA
jgi:hypothetical protein